MKIAMIGNIINQEDGSGIVELDIDDEGRMYLMQLGFEVVLMRGIESMKEEYASEINLEK